MKQEIIKQIETIKEDLFEISKNLYRPNPSTTNSESVLAKAQLLLERHQFQISKNQFHDSIVMKGQTEGMLGTTVAYFFDYTSSPENLLENWKTSMSTAMSLGAAIGLASVIKKIGGKIVIYGTPWEKKSVLVEEKMLKNIDMAIMLQAGKKTCKSGSSLNIRHVKLSFKSKSTAGSVFYEKGSNPLHGIIQSFNSIYSLGQSLPSSVEINGIITNGGDSPHGIPTRASAEFIISSPLDTSLEKTLEKVKNCAKGAAIQTGTEVSIELLGDSFDHLITNQTLSRLFCHNLKEVGIIRIHHPEKSRIALKIGTISHNIPSIYPCVGLENISPQEDMKTRAQNHISLEAQETIIKGARAAAFTALDVLSNKALLKEMKQEFKNLQKKHPMDGNI